MKILIVAVEQFQQEERYPIVWVVRENPMISFPPIGDPFEPLFGKEGKGEILWRIDYSKIPLNPPLLKGERYRRKIPGKFRKSGRIVVIARKHLIIEITQ
jgi:hypothetical protein